MYIQSGEWDIILNIKKKWKKANSLSTQMIFAMILVCIIPLIVISVSLVRGYHKQEIKKRQEKALEFCIDFANRIRNTGYLMNTAQTDLSVAMDTTAKFYEGRILVVNSELQVIKDTFHREEGKTIISEEVVNALQGKELTYHYDYGTTAEIICQVRDSLGTKILGGVIFVYATPTSDYRIGGIGRTALLWSSIVIVLMLCASIAFSSKMVFPIKQLSSCLKRLAEGDLEEKIEVKGNYEVEMIADSVNQMLNDMRTTEKRRQEFVSNVSHELKTPLTSMKVLAESLIGQQGLPEELYQEFLHDINSEIDRETKIITDLLNLVRLDREEGEMQIAQVSINELLQIVMKRLLPIAKMRNVEMIFESYRTVLAEVDEVKISLIFTNLIENAIKYNKEGGMVKVTLNADHRYFTVQVEDTGIGISEEARKYIFDRFYRVDKARSRQTGGTGLGLAITKSAVKMHKGNIKVLGKEGEGSVFVVRIPLSFVPEYTN